METALCTVDDKIWLASEFFDLGEKNIQVMRRNLLCTQCGGDAWFRKASYGNKVPHFCAHHTEDCTLSTNYEVVGEGDGDGDQPAADPDSGIVLDLGLEKDYNVEVLSPEPQNEIPTGQKFTKEKVIKGGGVNYPAHLTLKNVLYKLVRSDKLYTSDTKIIIPNNSFSDLPERANDLFVNFKSINEDLRGKKRIYWGFISDAGYTTDGRLWLNAGMRTDGLSVAISPDITEEFREYFKATESLQQFEGCHALVIGECYFTQTGKPIIWCSSLDFIIVRRYNFA